MLNVSLNSVIYFSSKCRRAPTAASLCLVVACALSTWARARRGRRAPWWPWAPWARRRAGRRPARRSRAGSAGACRAVTAGTRRTCCSGSASTPSVPSARARVAAASWTHRTCRAPDVPRRSVRSRVGAGCEWSARLLRSGSGLEAPSPRVIFRSVVCIYYMNVIFSYPREDDTLENTRQMPSADQK